MPPSMMFWWLQISCHFSNDVLNRFISRNHKVWTLVKIFFIIFSVLGPYLNGLDIYIKCRALQRYFLHQLILSKCFNCKIIWNYDWSAYTGKLVQATSWSTGLVDWLTKWSNCSKIDRLNMLEWSLDWVLAGFVLATGRLTNWINWSP